MSPASSPDPTRLANASVGKSYEFSLRSLLGLHDTSVQVQDVHVSFNTPCGLEFDPESLVLRGIPTVAGEMSVEVEFRTLTRKTASLTINPDPSSLWKNLPSDPNGKFATDDQQTAYLESPFLKICGASLRGRSHAHEGKYRDDNFAMRYVEETQWHLMVVADGAGSAKYSRQGALLACQVTLESLSKALAQPDNDLDQLLAGSDPDQFSLNERAVKVRLYTPLLNAAWQARSTIDAEAKALACESKDFHTTTLLVIAKKFSFGWFFASFSVGDGGIGIFVDSENLRLLNSPDSGDFGGQTLFLTHPKALSGGSEALIERLKFHVVPEFRWVSLMTDGITDPKFPSDQDLNDPQSWTRLESEMPLNLDEDSITEETPSKLLDWMQFPSPGNHDDRTILLAVPQPLTPMLESAYTESTALLESSVLESILPESALPEAPSILPESPLSLEAPSPPEVAAEPHVSSHLEPEQIAHPFETAPGESFTPSPPPIPVRVTTPTPAWGTVNSEDAGRLAPDLSFTRDITPPPPPKQASPIAVESDVGAPPDPIDFSMDQMLQIQSKEPEISLLGEPSTKPLFTSEDVSTPS